MRIDEVLVNRRTIHEYKTDEIPETLVKQALVAAVHAPNHKLTFPWKFVWAGPEVREKLADLGVDLKEKKSGKEMSEPMKKGVRSKLLNPPVLVAFCLKKTDDDFQAREDYASVACAVQNFKLSLWQHGIGTKWSTGALTRHENTYKWLAVDPSEFEIVGFVWAGYPQKIPPIATRPILAKTLQFTD